ncbi:MAG TPA: hypothetical protein VEA38_00960 [Terriglobales bacterium]|nr:hypothetical protein [Terriglobales bacterium]
MAHEPNGSLRLPWVVVLGFIVAAFGWGFVHLQTTKADRGEIAVIQQDVRDIRQFLMGPRR